MNLVGDKGQKHRTRLDISRSQLTVIRGSATSLHSQVLMLFTSNLWRSKRGKSFGQKAVWSKGRGNHTGQDETRVITCFFALSVPWRFYSWEQVHGDSQRHWWCPWHLMLLVITSLWTSPWVQSIFSLMITPGSPFLGRLTWLFAANSQLKHRMRSWWLTCGPSSKHGRKIGSGRVAIY